jgi:hypothetical protein
MINSPSLAADQDAISKAFDKANPGTTMSVSQKYPQVIPFTSEPAVGLETWLNLEELASVEIPENFSFAEKLGWSAGFLLSPAEYRSRVPIYGYKWHDVCFGAPTNASFLDRITTGTDLVLGAVDWTIANGKDSVGWYSSLEQACSSDPAQRTELAVTEKVEVLAQQLMSTVDSDNGVEKFLLTTVPLRNVGVIGEYIGVCDVAKIDPASGSVCQASLGLPVMN